MSSSPPYRSVTGSRPFDIALIVFLTLLLIVGGFRLRVYYRGKSAKSQTQANSLFIPSINHV